MRQMCLPIGVLLIAASLSAIGAPGTEPSDAPRLPSVLDDGDFFSPMAIAAAEKLAIQIKTETGTDVLVLTYSGVPEKKADELQTKGKDKFFADWVGELASQHKVRGILILMVDKPGHVEVGVYKPLLSRDFTLRDRNALRDLLADRFHRREFDRGLNEGMRFILDRIHQNQQSSGANAGVRDNRR